MQDIAHRLNADLDRYPPPQPIPGKGRRTVGAWTKSSVRDLLVNPKYTGYAGPNAAHRQAKRSYVLRSYVICGVCNRRMIGKARIRSEQVTIYYSCVTNLQHHKDQPWYHEHPKCIVVREDHILSVVGRFFGERILGPQRGLYLNQGQHNADQDAGLAAQRAALRTHYEPTGDDDIDTQWRAALQRRKALST